MVMPTSHADIQQELYTNGPMMVGFLVYDDFMDYSSGIYEKTSDSLVGGHAVKLIGWNEDSAGNLYWICQNQWATKWGDSGYFNIYANQCGLDAVAYACTPDID
jgi:C1A family cysteine protease